jgi:hypothetical protein
LLKVSENPPTRWPDAESISDFTGEWWVAHTKSRNEKALAHDLIRRGISYFLPMSWKVRRKSRRTVKSLLPLFAGYLFRFLPGTSSVAAGKMTVSSFCGRIAWLM